jgi:hypothetical protein
LRSQLKELENGALVKAEYEDVDASPGTPEIPA